MAKPARAAATDEIVSTRVLAAWFACSRAYVSELEGRKILRPRWR